MSSKILNSTSNKGLRYYFSKKKKTVEFRQSKKFESNTKKIVAE